MVLGTGVLSRRFCRPFWRGPFGYLTSPPWKVKPAKVVTKQKKTACYCSGIRAAKSLRDINRVGVIPKVQNSVYRIPRFKVNNMPDSTLLVHLPIEQIHHVNFGAHWRASERPVSKRRGSNRRKIVFV